MHFSKVQERRVVRCPSFGIEEIMKSVVPRSLSLNTSVVDGRQQSKRMVNIACGRFPLSLISPRKGHLAVPCEVRNMFTPPAVQREASCTRTLSHISPWGHRGKTGKKRGSMDKIRRRRPSKVWAGQRDDGRPPGISGRSHFALRALPPSPLGVTAAAAYSRLKSISRGHEHGSLSLTNGC